MNWYVGGSWTFVSTVSFSTADIVSWGIQRRMVVDGVWGCPIHTPLYRYLTTSLVSSSFLFPLSSFLFPLSSFHPSFLSSSLNTALNPRTRYPTHFAHFSSLTLVRARERVPYLEPLLSFNAEVKFGLLDLI